MIGVTSYALCMKNETLAANVLALRRHLGLKQEAFAERVGAKQSNVSRWEGRGETPEARPLAAMASLAACSVADFIDKPWSAPVRRLHPDLPPTIGASEGETVDIASLDLSFSMGPGTTIDDYVEETTVKFDLGFLRSITRAPAERLRLARGIGDSMFPTLLSNDRVMIDTTQRTLNLGDRVWAISLYGAAAIKRLRTAGPQRVLVISDNPHVENQEVDAEDLVIAGRVIWFGRDL